MSIFVDLQLSIVVNLFICRDGVTDGSFGREDFCFRFRNKISAPRENKKSQTSLNPGNRFGAKVLSFYKIRNNFRSFLKICFSDASKRSLFGT